MFQAHPRLSCHSLRISHFPKELCFLWLENDVLKPKVGSRAFHCYWNVIASRPSQLTKLGNTCMYTNLCIHIYMFLCIAVCIGIIKPWIWTDASNFNSIPQGSFNLPSFRISNLFLQVVRNPAPYLQCTYSCVHVCVHIKQLPLWEAASLSSLQHLCPVLSVSALEYSLKKLSRYSV